MGSVPCGSNWSQLIRKKKEPESIQRDTHEYKLPRAENAPWGDRNEPGKVLSLRDCQKKKASSCCASHRKKEEDEKGRRVRGSSSQMLKAEN